MKVLFSPEYRGHVFLGVNEENALLMDVMVCDATALIGMLELRLGIHVEDHPGHYRTVKYFEAMTDYMKKNPQNILSASFKLSSLGTAEQALRWRDSLVLDKWQGKEVADMERLNVLAGIEKQFDCPGMADRLKDILIYINKEKADCFKGIEVELPCAKDLLHPAVVELLEAMQEHGAKLTVKPTKEGKAKSNLDKVATMLQSTSKEKIKLDETDHSFLIYQFYDENAANEYLALKGDEIKADVWINNSNKAMDNWMRMMGKPTMGSTMAESMPQLLQLFVSGIDMMKEPLNIQSLISWLYAPIQPFGTYFGGFLAEAIISEGGYRNEACKELVDNYISGNKPFCFESYDDEELTEKEIAKRHQKESDERKQLVKTYLPAFEAAEESKSIDAMRLRQYLNSLSAWARNRAHYLREKPNNEGWCSQLESLAQMCDTFVLLIDSSGIKDQIDIKQVDSWVSTLYKGESFLQYAAQVGSRELIDSPAKMATRSKRTVWMNFVGGEDKHLDCSFLYPTEKNAVKDCLTIWDENKEATLNQMLQQLPFVMTDEQLILVMPEHVGGEIPAKHPILVRLESQVENLQDFIETPNLLDEKTESVKPIRNNNTERLLHFDHADRIKWPSHLSYSSLSTLVEYPLDFMMERILKIGSTGPSCIADLKTTKGNVAHAVIEHLFAPRDEKRCSKADEIAKRIEEEFDEQVRKQIEACGAILYLPENRLDAELLKEQLRRCLDVLLQIIRENNLVVTGCEHQVNKDMGLLQNDKNWDMIGFIDMTLEDENHHPVVFDFKWTTSKSYHRDLLTANRSVQLELYRDMLGTEKRDAVERTAYFLMPEAHLYSKEHFEGLNCTQITPENSDNIVEQLKQSFFYRKNQLMAGNVEIAEGFELGTIDYYNDTEANNLFPLKNEAGTEAANIFSNYTLFKGIQEDEA